VGPYFFNNIIGPRRQGWDRSGMRVYNQAFLLLIEKCLVVHSHPTHIPPLSTWTNNVRDNRENVVGPYFFNNIIGPRRQGWDRSGMRVYNQAFLLLIIVKRNGRKKSL
jgi:hypothetical protein